MGLLVLHWGHHPKVGVEASVVVPIDPAGVGELDIGQGLAKSKRVIHLSVAAARVLKAVELRQKKDRLRVGSLWISLRFVFTTETGEPCDPRNALRALDVAASRVNLGSIGLHTLRHSAATVMVENGVPLKVVSEILGHFSVRITGDIYAHVSPDVSSQAMDALGTALSG